MAQAQAAPQAQVKVREQGLSRQEFERMARAYEEVTAEMEAQKSAPAPASAVAPPGQEGTGSS